MKKIFVCFLLLLSISSWAQKSGQLNPVVSIEDGKIVAKPDPRKSRLDVVERAPKYRGKIQNRGI